MKKIMVLGAGPIQLPLIQTINDMDYQSVVLDYDKNAIGVPFSNIFFEVSIFDKDKIKDIAISEGVSAVLTTSEPALPIAIEVANELNLTNMTPETIITMSNKKKFRTFLKDNNFKYPRFIELKKLTKDSIKNLSFPVMSKPIDSSGSRGVLISHNYKELVKNFKHSKSFSKKQKVIIEEYIEPMYLLGGDLFVLNKKVLINTLMDDVRDNSGRISNFIPIGKKMPSNLSSNIIDKVLEELNKAFNLLDFYQGAVNVEIFVDCNEDIYFIELNPRHGGNNIPELIELSTNINQYELTVNAALNNNINIDHIYEEFKYMSYSIIYSTKEGRIKKIEFSDKLKKYIKREFYELSINDKVEFYSDASKNIGIILLEFPSEEIMSNVISAINEEIFIDID